MKSECMKGIEMMANLPPIADRILVRCGYLNPAKFPSFSSEFSLRHGTKSSSVRFEKSAHFPSTRRRSHTIDPSPVRSPSPDYFTGGNSKEFQKATPFSSKQRYFSCAAVAPVGSSALSSPLLLIPPSLNGHKIEDGKDFYNVFSIADNKEFKIRKPFNWQRELFTPEDAICFGSSHGWLGFIDRRNCYPYLLNPFIFHTAESSSSSSRLPFYIPLPALETLPLLRGFRVRSNGFSPSPSLTKHYIMYDDEKGLEIDLTMEQYLRELCFRNLIMSSPPLLHPFGGNANNDNNCIVMATYGDIILDFSTIVFCKPGDERWSVLEHHQLGDYVYVAYFSKDQCFYGVDWKGSIEAIDLSDPSSPKITTVIDDPDSHPHNPNLSEEEKFRLNYCGFDNKKTYLVESSGDLLLVLRFVALDVSEDGTPLTDYGVEKDPTLEVDDHSSHRFLSKYGTSRFEVHKLDFIHKRWELLESLGDRALFVGFNQPFSLSTTDYPHLRKNSIYFTDSNDDETWNRSYGLYDNGVFNLEDGCVTPFSQRSLKRIQSYYPPSSYYAVFFDQPPIFVAPNTC